MTYLYTRDLYDERESLRDRVNDCEDMRTDPDLDDDERAEGIASLQLDEDEAQRLAALDDLADEIGEDSMRDGETMIPVDDFEDYAQELAEDIGAVPSDAGWPAYCIDWERAARELAMDYSQVTFDGTDYYVRLG